MKTARKNGKGGARLPGPGQLVRAGATVGVQARPDGTRAEGVPAVLAKDQPCMIVGVVPTHRAGQAVELYGFVAPGTRAVGWVALPAETARGFWSA